MSALIRTRGDGGGDLEQLRVAAVASRAAAGFRNDRDPTTPEEESYWRALERRRQRSQVHVNGVSAVARTRANDSAGSTVEGLGRGLEQAIAREPWFGGLWIGSGPTINVYINSTLTPDHYEQADLALPLDVGGIPVEIWHADVGLGRGGVPETRVITLPDGSTHLAHTTRRSEEKLSALRVRDRVVRALSALPISGATIERGPNSPRVRVKVDASAIEDGAEAAMAVATHVPTLLDGVEILVEVAGPLLVAGAGAQTRTGDILKDVTTPTTAIGHWYTDSNGAVWEITDNWAGWTAPPPFFSSRMGAFSPWYPLQPLSKSDDDRPILKAPSPEMLRARIDAFAKRHVALAPASDGLPKIQTDYTDSKGGRWAYAYRSSTFGDEARAISADYPMFPLSMADDDTPDLTEKDRAALESSIDLFASRHTKQSLLGFRRTPPKGAPPPSTEPPVASAPPGESKPKTAAEATLPPPSADVATAIRQAAAVLDRSPQRKNLTEAGRIEHLAVGLLENRYGTQPDWYFTRPDGSRGPSFNWGALRARASDLFVEHGDRDASGKALPKVKFAAFTTQDAGLARFVEVFDKPDTLAAANRGDALATARAMYGHGYFEGSGPDVAARVDRYARAIASASEVVARVLGVKNPVFFVSPPEKPGGGTVVALAGAAALGIGVLLLRG